MNGWTFHGDYIVADLAAREAAVIRGLVGQIKDMLTARAAEAPQDELSEITGIRTGPSTPPNDRVLGRLLPAFYLQDSDTGEYQEDVTGETGVLRSLHEPELVQWKTGVAEVVLETCPPKGGVVRLDQDQADAWLAALNDVRLALGAALEVTDDMPELPDDDLQREHVSVYHWLTWVQDNLVETLSG